MILLFVCSVTSVFSVNLPIFLGGNGPGVNCPENPQVACDYSENDPQLWNEPYWWDNGNQSHDLCEGKVDLSIIVDDAISGDSLKIAFELFLDLDGDGVKETVVNSTQLGNQPGGLGWNNIMYGNVISAGQSRQFDGRAVSIDQKWGFAIVEEVKGFKKQASIRFNTMADPDTYVIPQLPHGQHKIRWTITDDSGQESICEYTVIIKDCLPPVVSCVDNQTFSVLFTGSIQLWHNEFYADVSDNCTLKQNIQYGIRKQGEGTGFPVDAQGNPQYSVTFYCDELGPQIVELWAIDLAGNASFCEANVIIQDYLEVCGWGQTASLSGQIKTETSDGLDGVLVEVTGTSLFTPPFTYVDVTDGGGYYSITNSIPDNSSITITPSENLNPYEGVTTYDLVLISKHIKGEEPLGSPYKMLAADANRSNSITTLDIIELRRLILGIYQHLPNNNAWRFMPYVRVFTNPMNPFADTIPESVSVNLPDDILGDVDFLAIKVGDVNGSIGSGEVIDLEDRATERMYLDLNDLNVKYDEEFEVPFSTSSSVLAYQLTMNIEGLEVLDFHGYEDVQYDNFAVFPGALTLSLDGAETFTIKFRALKSGNLSDMLTISSRITKAVAYNEAGEPLDIALRFNGTNVSERSFELYQNNPNPFVNSTAIGFYLPEASIATLTVFDQTVRLVLEQEGSFERGDNRFLIANTNENQSPGLYTYKVTSKFGSLVKSMLIVK